VQVDPIKPTLKPPAKKPLKLKRDELLSIFAFNFKLRRYMKGLDSKLGASRFVKTALPPLWARPGSSRSPRHPRHISNLPVLC